MNNSNKNSINNSKMAKYNSIFGQMLFDICFDIRFEGNTLTSNHHIFASPTIRLRYQSFGLHPNDESRIGTPLRQNLVYISLNLQGSGVWVPPPPWHMIMSLKLFYSCGCMRNILGLEWLKYTTNITIHFYSELKIKWDMYCQLRGMCLFFDI